MGTKVCFVSSVRYSQPLDTTSAKKFQRLQSLGELFVIGFSQDLWPRSFATDARFFLLPKLPMAPLRYLELSVIALILVCWLIIRHRVQIFVAQSPYEGFAVALAKSL